ncbi:MAG: hypothetical protein IJI11_01950 [Mogibacterium sp.]|nr:hypothetical protein [Mogibacterium sp.]
MKRIKRIISILVIAAVAVTFMPIIDDEVYAASKKPAAPQILSSVETTTIYDDFKVVVVSWAKAKRAKKYQVAIRSMDPKWVKIKTVKKTKKNKKKYTKAGKYRVVAQGKKYKVYEYKYEYTKMGTTKSCSYRFTEAPGWEDLQPNTSYMFAVRSVNGKKYSKWSTIGWTTSASSWENKSLTTPGQSLQQVINGQTYTFTVGAQCSMPMPNPTAGPVSVPAAFVMTPSEIEYHMERSPGPVNDIFRESVITSGTAPDGYKVSWRIDLVNGKCESVLKLYDHPTFNSDWSKFNVESWFGYVRRDYTINDPNVQIAWTLDGTEPKLGQADKTITDIAEYPFGQIISDGAVYTGSLQVRGTITGPGKDSIWGEIGRAGAFRKCMWIRFYEGTQLVKEEIQMN